MSRVYIIVKESDSMSVTSAYTSAHDRRNKQQTNKGSEIKTAQYSTVHKITYRSERIGHHHRVHFRVEVVPFQCQILRPIVRHNRSAAGVG